ncbi:hypothetical protein CW304_03665 [Bacillus sp. UFRGS-B20]|nr:hypothetical protein CW304_03665 [Bacillus sp. UFRGS-B20]
MKAGPRFDAEASLFAIAFWVVSKVFFCRTPLLVRLLLNVFVRFKQRKFPTLIKRLSMALRRSNFIWPSSSHLFSRVLFAHLLWSPAVNNFC